MWYYGDNQKHYCMFLFPHWKLSLSTGPDCSGLKHKSCQLNNKQLNFNCNLLSIYIYIYMAMPNLPFHFTCLVHLPLSATTLQYLPFCLRYVLSHKADAAKRSLH